MPQQKSDVMVPADPASGRVRFGSFVGRGPIRWLIVCGILLIAAIALVTSFAIGDFRQRALEAHQH